MDKSTFAHRLRLRFAPFGWTNRLAHTTAPPHGLIDALIRGERDGEAGRPAAIVARYLIRFVS
jgi:hypothetical protein